MRISDGSSDVCSSDLIATGSESLVTEGVTGRLIRPGAIDAFADALACYCTDEEARLAAGRAAAEVSGHYGWDEVNQALVVAYSRVIRQPAAEARQPSTEEDTSGHQQLHSITTTVFYLQI